MTAEVHKNLKFALIWSGQLQRRTEKKKKKKKKKNTKQKQQQQQQQQQQTKSNSLRSLKGKKQF